jgi:hypothetical protein
MLVEARCIEPLNGFLFCGPIAETAKNSASRLGLSTPPSRLVHSKCARSGASRLLLVQPVVDTLARRVFGDAGAFLNLAFKLFALAGNFVEIIIRKMTPLLLDLVFELLPVSFDAIPNCKLLWFQSHANISPQLAPLTAKERRWFHRCLGVSIRTSGFHIGLLVFLS